MAKLEVSRRLSNVLASAARRSPLPVLAADTMMLFFVVVKENFPFSS
jgi:hypothetical protein